MDRPNVPLIMTDQGRYPAPYEDDAVRALRREHMPAHGLVALTDDAYFGKVGGATQLPITNELKVWGWVVFVQLAFLAHYPAWSGIIIGADLLVIYALAVHGGAVYSD